MAIAVCCSAAIAADSDAVRLARRATGATPMEAALRELCDTIGGRPTGSTASNRAVEWAVKAFRATGIADVHLEPFTVPNLWLAESAEAMVVAPASFPVRVAAAPFTVSTRDTLEAPVVDAGEGVAEDFARVGQRHAELSC